MTVQQLINKLQRNFSPEQEVFFAEFAASARFRPTARARDRFGDGRSDRCRARQPRKQAAGGRRVGTGRLRALGEVTMPLVKFPSHRMRDRASAYIANMEEKARFSFYVPSCYGIYEVTDAELSAMKAARKPRRGFRFSVVREKLDTFHKCWS